MGKSFRDTLQELVNLSDEDKLKCALGAYQDLLPALTRFDSDSNGLVLSIAIMGTAAAADGKLTAQELAFIMALAKSRGLELSLEQTVELIKQSADKDGFELIRSLSGALEDEKKAALVLFVATICALDDRISQEEVKYLESLL